MLDCFFFLILSVLIALFYLFLFCFLLWSSLADFLCLFLKVTETDFVRVIL